MRSCYVAIPFGVRRDAEGRELDFDYLYQAVLRPAVQELDIECSRLDDLLPGAIWLKSLFSAILASDLMIAEVSTHNPNVLYELGIRHATQRGRTLLIGSRGSRLPADVGASQPLWYEPDASGRLTGEPAERFRNALQAALRQSRRTTISDSPLYEFFPDLEVVLPPELETARRRHRRPPAAKKAFAQRVIESPVRTFDELVQSEEEVRGAPQADPVEYLTLLRKYRDLSEWDRVIALADDAPPEIAESPEVRQLLALALNRRGGPGDPERAIALMENLIAETGGDSETFGVLGRIYKDKYDHALADGQEAAAAAYLEQALQNYRAGFEKNSRDFYPGINVVNLLLQRGDAAAQAEILQIVPRVRAAVAEKRESGRLDFWELATELQLAVVARDWPAAAQAAQEAAAQAPSAWTLDTTLRDLRAVGLRLADPDDRRRLAEVMALLRPAEAEAEAGA